MKEYISKEDSLNFEMEIEATQEDIQSITEGMSIYAEYIKNLPTVTIQEWIPVEKELPKDGIYVLVFVNYNGFLFCDVDSYHLKTKKFLNNTEYVTHWMELPEFPTSILKGEKNDVD